MKAPGGVRLFAERLLARGTRRAGVRGLLVAGILALALSPLRAGHGGFVAAAEAAVACVADCNGNDAVSIEELRLAVEIALLRAAPGDCLAADVDSDGVTIEELVQAVRARVETCVGANPTPSPTPAVPMVVSGRCRRPGPGGLVACDTGFDVDVLRCDDRPTCLEATSAKTLLGNGPIGAQGAFSIVIDQQLLGDKTMLVQAEAALQPATIYRILDIGPLGVGGGRGRPVDVPEVAVEIDPSSEGAMRTLETQRGPLGLDAYSNDDIQNLVELTRATAGDYAGLTPELAAQAGQQVASGLADPQLRSFVSDLGLFAYHVLSSGAFAYRFTTLAVSSSPTGSGICASSSDVLFAGAVAAFVPDANIVTKSAILPGENVIFNSAAGMGVGRVCVGGACLADASCPVGTNDCHVFSYDLNSTPLVQGTFDVPDGVKVFLQNTGPCLFDANTFAFGTSQPTVASELQGPVPADGFTLPAGTTIVFAQRPQPGDTYFAGVGGFRLRSVAGATVLSGAAARGSTGDIPAD